MKVVGVIPARFRSSRFPGKPLVPLLGSPMVVHVARLVALALGHDRTFVATESGEIARVVEEHGFSAIMTTDRPLTGTDRVYEAAQHIDADVYLNIQGDEPLLDPMDIRRIADEKRGRRNQVINGMCRIGPGEDPSNVNIPKVVTTEGNALVYMSRLPIPGYKSPSQRPLYYLKQVCIYAFSFQELEQFGSFGRKSYLEEKEDIEILRFLDLGVPVHMVETGGASLAVDTPGDVVNVEEAMRARGRTALGD
ncbi:MAG TPA: 3-deoxy-manno-octulosonate cytidylyltransferase [Methanomicrobiales archaeon]|nr:3-deoxy-manno-octulosonate cytidylyltransferase [Methanomicrobiales archaeon]